MQSGVDNLPSNIKKMIFKMIIDQDITIKTTEPFDNDAIDKTDSVAVHNSLLNKLNLSHTITYSDGITSKTNIMNLASVNREFRRLTRFFHSILQRNQLIEKISNDTKILLTKTHDDLVDNDIKENLVEFIFLLEPIKNYYHDDCVVSEDILNNMLEVYIRNVVTFYMIAQYNFKQKLEKNPENNIKYVKYSYDNKKNIDSKNEIYEENISNEILEKQKKLTIANEYRIDEYSQHKREYLENLSNAINKLIDFYYEKEPKNKIKTINVKKYIDRITPSAFGTAFAIAGPLMYLLGTLPLTCHYKTDGQLDKSHQAHFIVKNCGLLQKHNIVVASNLTAAQLEGVNETFDEHALIQRSGLFVTIASLYFFGIAGYRLYKSRREMALHKQALSGKCI